MLRLEYQIIIAAVLDMLIGDPRCIPHPVRWIGRLALYLETRCRLRLGSTRLSGTAALILVLTPAGGGAWALLYLTGMVNPHLRSVIAILMIYFSFAARDLIHHSRRVYHALQDSDIIEARRRVGMIVGRDTETLTEQGVVRAAVESVAESLVDGITSPLFFAFIFGPVGAVVYRAVNTLDSTFGYRNEHYRDFGWSAARLDDAANYLPARLTAFFLVIAAFLLRKNPLKSLRILLRDGRRHSSPNAGLAEAAAAGALGLQLGGTSNYSGLAVSKPTIGDDIEPPERKHILQANTLILTAAAIFIGFGLLIRILLVSFS